MAKTRKKMIWDHDVVSYTEEDELRNAKTDYEKLLVAASWDDVSLSEELIRNGVQINPNVKEFVQTPLFVAAQNGSLNVAKLLIDNKADVNQPSTSANGSTPLLTAISSQKLEMIDFLIKENADVNVITKEGENALDLLFFWGLLYSGVEFTQKAFQLLFVAGINLSIKSISPEKRFFKFEKYIIEQQRVLEEDRSNRLSLLKIMLFNPEKIYENYNDKSESKQVKKVDINRKSFITKNIVIGVAGMAALSLYSVPIAGGLLFSAGIAKKLKKCCESRKSTLSRKFK